MLISQRPTLSEEVISDNPSQFVIEPLEPGFGYTLGNSLRRTLLSSIPGAAVTSIRIDGVLHEFSSVPGVREDVTDLILNIKQLALTLHGDGPKRMTLKAKGPSPVTAGQIQTPADIEIMNPALVICHLDDGANLSIEFEVNTGKGYVPASANRREDDPVGRVRVEAIFARVRRVAYKVENPRVGQQTDYDRLSMTVETNGAVKPEDAV